MLLILLGCTPTCEDDQINDPITGDCVELWSDPSTPEEALAALPDCSALPGGNRIDLVQGCVDGACVGMRLGEIEADLGDAECDSNAFEDDLIGCEWDWGVLALFHGEDGSLPSDATATTVAAKDDFDGADPDGLGLGISLNCYLDTLGEPDDIDYTETDAGLSPWYTRWDGVGAFTDFFGSNYGEVTSLYLHGMD